FFQAEDGIRDRNVTGVQTCALPILRKPWREPTGDIELGQREVGENLPDIHGPSLGEKQNHSADADQISRCDARGAVAVIVLVNEIGRAACRERGAEEMEAEEEIGTL